MVDMKCEGCVTAVKNKLQALEGIGPYYLILYWLYETLSIVLYVSTILPFTTGIKNIEVDLSNQVVRVLGSLPVKTMLDALHQTGRDARLVGQGNPNGLC